ncbi:MAG TPA: hypothetical protein VMU00_09410 [Steroidobacteraceae bacterium]|nr:hypothetical protein [Steroidobacteraceae bacterium]
MGFRCRSCDSTRYAPVTVTRPDGTLYRSSLYACEGCSTVFTDPARFSRLPPSDPSESVERRGWESRRTVAKRSGALR